MKEGLDIFLVLGSLMVDCYQVNLASSRPGESESDACRGDRLAGKVATAASHWTAAAQAGL